MRFLSWRGDTFQIKHSEDIESLLLMKWPFAKGVVCFLSSALSNLGWFFICCAVMSASFPLLGLCALAWWFIWLPNLSKALNCSFYHSALFFFSLFLFTFSFCGVGQRKRAKEQGCIDRDNSKEMPGWNTNPLSKKPQKNIKHLQFNSISFIVPVKSLVSP